MTENLYKNIEFWKTCLYFLTETIEKNEKVGKGYIIEKKDWDSYLEYMKNDGFIDSIVLDKEFNRLVKRIKSEGHKITIKSIKKQIIYLDTNNSTTLK